MGRQRGSEHIVSRPSFIICLLLAVVLLRLRQTDHLGILKKMSKGLVSGLKLLTSRILRVLCVQLKNLGFGSIGHICRRSRGTSKRFLSFMHLKTGRKNSMCYTIGPRSLRKVAPELSSGGALAVAKSLGEALHRFGITNQTECAHFVAQCAHESEGFTVREEIWGPTATQAGCWKRKDLGNWLPYHHGLSWPKQLAPQCRWQGTAARSAGRP